MGYQQYVAFTGTVSSELGCLSEVRRNVLFTNLGSDFCSGHVLHLQISRCMQAPRVTVCVASGVWTEIDLPPMQVFLLKKQLCNK